MNREFRFSKDVNSEEYANAGIAKKSRLRRTGGLLFMLIFLSGCPELADVLIESANPVVCVGCDWIIQEWDSDGWNTHNSDPYDTEAICEQALARQSKDSPDRGHRCIYEVDLRNEEKTVVKPSAHCYGCDWAVEVAKYNNWARAESTTYDTEGVCQQALWHQSKKNPNSDYRCTNLDM